MTTASDDNSSELHNLAEPKAVIKRAFVKGAEHLALSERDTLRMLELLKNPPAATARLIRAANRKDHMLAPLKLPHRTVMRGLVPRIHVFMMAKNKTWMAGTSPAMTVIVDRRCYHFEYLSKKSIGNFVSVSAPACRTDDTPPPARA